MISIKSSKEIDNMRAAGAIVAEVMRLLAREIKKDVTTSHLDRAAYELIRDRGATPSFKGYRGFPKSICTSVNNEVIHGMPSARKLCDGDIISIDVGVCHNGYHADRAKTFAVGDISGDAQRLINATRESFYEAIRYARAGERLSNISSAVQRYVEDRGFSVVREYVGHGVGSKLHEDPAIPNYGNPGKGPRLCAGMTIAIEPMVNFGRKDIEILSDGWTVVTKDGSLSAHYEHTVLITDNDPVLITAG